MFIDRQRLLSATEDEDVLQIHPKDQSLKRQFTWLLEIHIPKNTHVFNSDEEMIGILR
jgi:hypothetical protein